MVFGNFMGDLNGKSRLNFGVKTIKRFMARFREQKFVT